MDEAEISKVVEEVLRKLGLGKSNITPEYYSIKDAAVVVSLSPDHIRRAVVGGALDASDVGTKDHPLYRISRESLMRWMKEREAGPKPPIRKSKAVPISRHYKSPRQKSD